ncbi:hypothetical protein ACFSJ3_12665 [Corallincola platygyrae]|uniref:Uncharacterized protein n=1 Tax=Corallincola platygyrae TaxID=1193278 RepID=A0ABW4XPD4_9GAMM
MSELSVKQMDEIISSLAESNSNDSKPELYSLIKTSEIFSVVEESGNKISLQTADIDGNKMVVFHTSRSGAAAGKRVAGMRGEKALEMIINSGNADGFLLQSSKDDSWVAISNSKIKEILG